MALLEMVVTFLFIKHAHIYYYASCRLRCCLSIAVVREPEAIPETSSGNIVVGGYRKRWLNISSTVIVERGRDQPSFGDYTCSVCRERGTPSQKCYNATLLLHILGAAPKLLTSNSKGMKNYLLLSLTLIGQLVFFLSKQLR